GVAAIVVEPGHLALDTHGEIAAPTVIAHEIMATVPPYPDAIPLAYGRNSLAESIYAAGDFVTRHTRILQPRPESVFHHHVAMADPASFHFHTHLPRPWLGNIAFDQLEVAARLAHLGGSHHSYRHTFCRHTALRLSPYSPPRPSGTASSAFSA